MKIALTQREIVLDNAAGRFVFDALERIWYKFLVGHDLLVIPNSCLIDHIDADCVIITGGPDSMARHCTENKVYSYAREHDIPVIGICHGGFVINDLEGGDNGHIDNHHGVDHDVVMQGRTYTVNSYHSQCISTLAPDLLPMAWDNDNHVEAFHHKSKPIYGVIWHPERQSTPVLPDAINELLFRKRKL